MFPLICFGGLVYKSRFLLIIIHFQKTINIYFLNTHALCYKAMIQNIQHSDGIILVLIRTHPFISTSDRLRWIHRSALQYIPRNMHTVFALLCFVVVIHWLIFPYPSGLLHWHCGNLTIAPVPAKQPWWIWINTWIHYERMHNHNKAKHNKTVCIFLGIYCTYRQMQQPGTYRCVSAREDVTPVR